MSGVEIINAESFRELTEFIELYELNVLLVLWNNLVSVWHELVIKSL